MSLLELWARLLFDPLPVGQMNGNAAIGSLDDGRFGRNNSFSDWLSSRLDLNF